MIYSNLEHSLSAAVESGLVTDPAAFCGLSKNDIEALATSFPKVELLVRFRNSEADGREIMTVEAIYQWRTMNMPLNIRERSWFYRDIRDITAVSI